MKIHTRNWTSAHLLATHQLRPQLFHVGKCNFGVIYVLYQQLPLIQRDDLLNLFVNLGIWCLKNYDGLLEVNHLVNLLQRINVKTLVALVPNTFFLIFIITSVCLLSFFFLTFLWFDICLEIVFSHSVDVSYLFVAHVEDGSQHVDVVDWSDASQYGT